MKLLGLGGLIGLILGLLINQIIQLPSSLVWPLICTAAGAGVGKLIADQRNSRLSPPSEPQQNPSSAPNKQ